MASNNDNNSIYQINFQSNQPDIQELKIRLVKGTCCQDPLRLSSDLANLNLPGVLILIAYHNGQEEVIADHRQIVIPANIYVITVRIQFDGQSVLEPQQAVTTLRGLANCNNQELVPGIIARFQINIALDDTQLCEQAADRVELIRSGPTFADLRWNPVLGAEYYLVYYNTSNEDEIWQDSFINFPQVSTVTNQVRITNLEPETQYFIEIEAYCCNQSKKARISYVGNNLARFSFFTT